MTFQNILHMIAFSKVNKKCLSVFFVSAISNSLLSCAYIMAPTKSKKKIGKSEQNPSPRNQPKSSAVATSSRKQNPSPRNQLKSSAVASGSGAVRRGVSSKPKKKTAPGDRKLKFF